MLDLTMLAEPGRKFCVRCYDKESTDTFLREMIRQYPDRCEFWSGREDKWDERSGEYVDYFPYLNNVEGRNLAWDDCDWAEDNGYDIIDYYDLPGARKECVDFGEITCSERDISVLF